MHPTPSLAFLRGGSCLGDIPHSPLGGKFIALGRENARRESCQCWEPQGMSALRRGASLPSLLGKGESLSFLSPVEVKWGVG